MSESEPFAAPATMPGAFPKKMLIFTGLAYAIIILAFTFISEMEDLLGHGVDVIWVMSLFFSIFMIFLWVCWFLFLSRWNWAWRIVASCLLISVPFVFVKVLRPVNGGDATIARFDPIWNRRPEVAPVAPSANTGGVDLKTETANDFPRFLGSSQDSVIRDRGRVDSEAFEKAEVLWKQPIGRGWSGFVARNGFAVTMEQREEQECVTCYEVTSGELKWIYQHKARHLDEMNLGRIGPRSTPTIHRGMVYAVGAVGNFVCLDGLSGDVIWQVDLNEVLGLTIATEKDADGLIIQHEEESSLSWGRSGSPLIIGDTVVIPGGGPRSGPKVTLLAFDAISGEIRWKSGEEMIAYGSPTLGTVAGIQQILLTAETKVMGFDATTGAPLWEFPRPGETDGGANTSQVTIVSSNQVMTSKGYPDGGGELIELSNEGGTIIPRSVWNNPRVLKTKLMSPVLYEGHSYSLSNGFLECARLADGERIWKRRGRFGHGQMLLIENQVLLHSEFGGLTLLQASSEGYKELGSLKTIEGVCWNTLCLAGDKLLVRSEIEAACIRLPFVTE